MSKLMSFAGHALSNLFHKPVTSNYPAVKNEFTDRTRGSVVIDTSSCVFCGMCAKKCPSDAITVDRATKTWSIERMGCVQCSNCVNSCPKKCLSMDRHYTTPDTQKTVDSYTAPVTENESENKGGSGDVLFNAENCIYCTLCARKCPAGAITVDRENKKWEINNDECLHCGACVEACRKNALSMGE